MKKNVLPLGLEDLDGIVADFGLASCSA